MICPECQKNGLKSNVILGPQVMTLEYIPIMWDENGNQISPKPRKSQYSCTNGHHFDL